MVRFSIMIVPLFILACGSAKTNQHHTPFANTDWSRTTPMKQPGVSRNAQLPEKPSESSASRPSSEDRDIREEMVAAAKALPGSDIESPGYGSGDLQGIFSKLGIRVDWNAAKGLEALVKIAEKKGAYHTGPDPEAGDVVLFHNQVDANGNGAVDDWLTGSGIVTHTKGRTFFTVVRTGHAAKEVTVTPDGPGRYDANGEVVNSFLRVPTHADPKDTLYLAGQLYAGYIDIEALASE